MNMSREKIVPMTHCRGNSPVAALIVCHLWQLRRGIGKAELVWMIGVGLPVPGIAAKPWWELPVAVQALVASLLAGWRWQGATA